jgi:CheY-like chemotaxis protein
MTHLHSDHRRILLVDPNPSKRNLRASILKNYEIEVHTAGSMLDAASFWTTNSYDLVLLAAQENSEAAIALSVKIRGINPRQRIGLLVGPPAFVQELGGKRKKAASTRGAVPSSAVENPGEPAASQHDASPQWQETIRRLVTDWNAGQNGLLGLPEFTDTITGA